jgi:hypothetical protein
MRCAARRILLVNGPVASTSGLSQILSPRFRRGLFYLTLVPARLSKRRPMRTCVVRSQTIARLCYRTRKTPRISPVGSVMRKPSGSLPECSLPMRNALRFASAITFASSSSIDISFATGIPFLNHAIPNIGKQLQPLVQQFGYATRYVCATDSVSRPSGSAISRRARTPCTSPTGSHRLPRPCMISAARKACRSRTS